MIIIGKAVPGTAPIAAPAMCIAWRRVLIEFAASVCLLQQSLRQIRGRARLRNHPEGADLAQFRRQDIGNAVDKDFLSRISRQILGGHIGDGVQGYEEASAGDCARTGLLPMDLAGFSFNTLGSDPRFQHLLRRMGLPQ